MAGDPTATFDHLTDGVSGTGAQVVYVVCTRPHGVQCQQVRSAEVDDVQIVADAGPVAGLVITSKIGTDSRMPRGTWRMLGMR